MQLSWKQINYLWKVGCPVSLTQIRTSECCLLFSYCISSSAYWVTKDEKVQLEKWSPHIMHCHSISADSLWLSICSFIDMECGFSVITSLHECSVFYVLDFVQVLACFLSAIWGVFRTNGSFWHRFTTYIREFSWSSLNKMGLIW